MQYVKLTIKERDLCVDTAQKLYVIHGKGGVAKLRNIIIGLLAEYAAIKYFNFYLGALYPIPFRTEYNEWGGDGGFDFAYCRMRWDVKFSRDHKIPLERLVRSTSEMIIVCDRLINRLDSLAIRVAGCFPRERAIKLIREGDSGAYELLPFARIHKLFPNSFGPKRLEFSQKPPDFSRPTETLDNLINKLEK